MNRAVDRFAYVRDAYGMPWLKRGIAVLADGKPGTVTDATHYVFVRLNTEKHARPYHPRDVTQIEVSGVARLEPKT
jgi:hypothetical protein